MDVLVIPRERIPERTALVVWESAEPDLWKEADWMPRERAETSREWVQPIPCAVMLTLGRKHHIFRRVRQGRKDLRSRISLVIGGHVERDDSLGEDNLANTVERALMREIQEELGIVPEEAPRPLGLLVDASSIAASRHIALVHEVITQQRVQPQPRGEFCTRSRLGSRTYSAEELAQFRLRLDPWSAILFDQHYRKDGGSSGAGEKHRETGNGPQETPKQRMWKLSPDGTTLEEGKGQTIQGIAVNEGCNQRCWNAQGNTCRCSCMGENHSAIHQHVGSAPRKGREKEDPQGNGQR